MVYDGTIWNHEKIQSFFADNILGKNTGLVMGDDFVLYCAQCVCARAEQHDHAVLLAKMFLIRFLGYDLVKKIFSWILPPQYLSFDKCGPPLVPDHPCLEIYTHVSSHGERSFVVQPYSGLSDVLRMLPALTADRITIAHPYLLRSCGFRGRQFINQILRRVQCRVLSIASDNGFYGKQDIDVTLMQPCMKLLLGFEKTAKREVYDEGKEIIYFVE